MRSTVTLALLAVFLLSNAVLAHEKAPHTKKAANRSISTEEKAFGREGDPKKVSRTIKVEMSDTMRFTPSQLAIKQGETVRFEVRNSGKTMHELVLGTM